MERDDYRRETLGETRPSEAFGPGTVPPPVAAAADTPVLAEESLAPRLTGDKAGPRYEFTGLLGTGASGAVYAVYDRDLERPIAVKVLRGAAGPGGEEVRGFLDEARVTASLSHPHVLPVHDLAIDAAGRPCFSMSRIDGVTLGQVLERSASEARDPRIAAPNAVVTIFIAVCHAIAYAHSRGIVHQDIKPDNILLGDYGEVLVLDWGSASRVGDDGRCVGRLYGTPLYMSPEQARRDHASRASDVYCIGASLFHALTLRVPAWSEDEQVFWAAKRRGEIDPPTPVEADAVPPELLSIALKALTPEPERRYASVSDLARDLERYQAGLAVSAHREPLIRMLARWYRANRRLFWVASTALVAIALLIAAIAAEKAKERSRWLLRSEDFSGAADVRWRATVRDWEEPRARIVGFADPHFQRAAGGIVIRSDSGYADLAYRLPQLGDLRVEWTYTSLAHGTDLDCFIEGDDRVSGYTFHIGGFDLPGSVTLTKGAAAEVLQRRFGQPLAANRPYHFVMEKEGSRLRLGIDGATVIDFRDLDADIPETGTFGFDTCNSSANRIEDVQIWHRPLAQRITPIDFARRLVEMGRYREAYAQFADVLDAYGDATDLAPDAIYGMAMCCARQGDAEGARRLLARFELEHPDHELKPYVLRERASLASADDNDAERARCIDALAAYPGHPAQRSVATRLVDDELQRACPIAPTVIGGDRYPSDAPERIVRSAAKLRPWLTKLGIPLAETPFSSRAIAALNWLGRQDLILELFPENRRECSGALLRMGRFDEVLARYADLRDHRGHALLHLGRLDELMADDTAAASDRRTAFIAAGKAELGLATMPDDPDLLDALGRRDEALARAPTDSILRARLLIEAGRDEEVLAIPSAPHWARTFALLALGRRDEALRECADSPGLVAGCAASMAYSLEDHQRGRQLLKRLASAQAPLDNDEVWFPHFFLPMLLANGDGETIDPRRELAQVLDHGRWWVRQLPWYTASYLVGDIDDERFLAQPQHFQVEDRLHFARGLRAELRRDWEAARAEFAACSGDHTVGLVAPEREYIHWRLTVPAR